MWNWLLRLVLLLRQLSSWNMHLLSRLLKLVWLLRHLSSWSIHWLSWLLRLVWLLRHLGSWNEYLLRLLLWWNWICLKRLLHRLGWRTILRESLRWWHLIAKRRRLIHPLRLSWHWSLKLLRHTPTSGNHHLRLDVLLINSILHWLIHLRLHRYHWNCVCIRNTAWLRVWRIKFKFDTIKIYVRFYQIKQKTYLIIPASLPLYYNLIHSCYFPFFLISFKNTTASPTRSSDVTSSSYTVIFNSSSFVKENFSVSSHLGFLPPLLWVLVFYFNNPI